MLALKFISKTVIYNKKKYICNLMDSNPCVTRYTEEAGQKENKDKSCP